MNGQFISIATSFINWETSDEFLGPDRLSPRQLNSGYGILGQSNASALRLIWMQISKEMSQNVAKGT